MNYPVTSIVFTNKSDLEIANFSKTVKSKNVNVKMSKEKVKINRKYNNRDKNIFIKEKVSSEFSIFNDLAVVKQLSPDTEEISFFENIKVELINSKKNTNLTLYNCNIEMSTELNYKYDKESTTTFKINSQGTDGKYWELLTIE